MTGGDHLHEAILDKGKSGQGSHKHTGSKPSKVPFNGKDVENSPKSKVVTLTSPTAGTLNLFYKSRKGI